MASGQKLKLILKGGGQPRPRPGGVILAWNTDTETDVRIQWTNNSGIVQYLEWST